MEEAILAPAEAGEEVAEKIPQRTDCAWMKELRKLPLSLRGPAAGVVWWDLSNGMEGHPRILALVNVQGPMWPRPDKENLAAALVRLGYPADAAQRRLKSLDSIWAATGGQDAPIIEGEA